MLRRIKIRLQVSLTDAVGGTKMVGNQFAFADRTVHKPLAHVNACGYILNRQHPGSPLAQN
jgi:hypothetical protein